VLNNIFHRPSLKTLYSAQRLHVIAGDTLRQQSLFIGLVRYLSRTWRNLPGGSADPGRNGLKHKSQTATPSLTKSFT
jgi:hypothetical protein